MEPGRLLAAQRMTALGALQPMAAEIGVPRQSCTGVLPGGIRLIPTLAQFLDRASQGLQAAASATLQPTSPRHNRYSGLRTAHAIESGWVQVNQGLASSLAIPTA